MTLPLVFNNSVYPAGEVAIGTQSGNTFTVGNSAGFLSPFDITLNGTINAVGDTVTATGNNGNYTATYTATGYDNSGTIVFSNMGQGYIVSNSPLSPSQSVTYTENNLGDFQVVCYVTGTRIATHQGDVCVEDLQVGDLAVTASGQERPIRWIGSRKFDRRHYDDPAAVMPIRIRRGALGECRPARDLVVSPGHALCLDILGEVLIPAGALVNGSTIVQEDVDSVTYWHVELDSHDLLLAEGQPAESYIDMGNRAFFAHHSGAETLVDLNARPDVDLSQRTHDDFCRPFHGGGPLVDVVRAQLRRRAEALGWHLSQPDSWTDTYLEVDGQIVRPKVRDLSACFVLPADAQEMFLVSPASVPRDVSDYADSRQLGLCLKSLSFDDGLGEPRAVALDDAVLGEGFHTMSPGHRWTDGRARVPSELLAGLKGPVFLRMELNCPPLPHWIAPEKRIEGAGETSTRSKEAA